MDVDRIPKRVVRNIPTQNMLNQPQNIVVNQNIVNYPHQSLNQQNYIPTQQTHYAYQNQPQYQH